MSSIFKSVAGVYQSAFTKEGDYDKGTTQACDVKHIMGASWTPPTPVATTVTDAGFTNGAEGPTDVLTVTKHYAGSFQFDRVYPNSLASMLAYTFGAPTTSTVDTSGKQHIFADDDTDRVLDSFTTEYRTTAAGSDNLKFGGCLIQSMTLSMAKNQPMTLSASWLARERSADGTATTAVITTEPAMLGHGVTAWLADGVESSFAPVLGTADVTGNVVELSGTTNQHLTSFNLTVTNITDPSNLYTFNDDELFRPTRNVRTVTGDFTMDKESEAIADYLQANTTPAFEIDWKSGTLAGAGTHYYGCEIVIPKLHITSPSTSWGADGRQTGQYSFEALDDSTNGRFIGVVINKTEAYAG